LATRDHGTEAIHPVDASADATFVSMERLASPTTSRRVFALGDGFGVHPGSHLVGGDSCRRNQVLVR
jgi:hypothetical protein